jgi:hypothetical protein
MALDRTTFTSADPRVAAQNGDYSAALVAIGDAATGVAGYLAANTFALIGTQTHPVIDADGVVQADVEEIADDGVLATMGLRLVHVPNAGSMASDVASLAALEMRLGLLTLMLDTAHRHLKPRKSFGQKTLHHQLVKADFGDASGTLILLQSKIAYRRKTGDMSGLAADHAKLSATELQSEKLMGGHGYLIGGTHEISYVSMLLRGLFGGETL